MVPGALTGLLVALPYFEVGPSRRYGNRRIGLSAAALSVAGLAVLSFMGSPWYKVTTSPDQEAVAALLPQTHPGPLREADWSELAFGTYTASDWATAPTPTLQSLLHLFADHLAGAASPDRRDIAAFMVVEDWQTDLKKITLRVTWTQKDGSPYEFSQSVYLHRNHKAGEDGSRPAAAAPPAVVSTPVASPAPTPGAGG
jgi:hypothetical protein